MTITQFPTHTLPCAAVCAPSGLGGVTAPRRELRAVLPPFGEVTRTKEKAGESCSAFLAPKRLLPPAVRTVLETGETKTSQGRRTIHLPPSTVRCLRERKKHAFSQWIFPTTLAPEKPVRPGVAYYRMKAILKESGLLCIRFHDLRHP